MTRTRFVRKTDSARRVTGGPVNSVPGSDSIRRTMTQIEQAPRLAAGLEAAERWLPALLLLFVGSGCAALIYEVVWFQLLQLSVGSSAVSLGILLGIFMGGMCLGSLLLPRWIGPRHHPLKVYAGLELGIGLCGVVVLYAVPVIGESVHAHRGDGPGERHSPRARCQHLPGAADRADGRHAARHRALGGGDANRRLVAWVFLRRQPRGCRGGQRARRLLPAPRVRHADGDVGRRGAERARVSAGPGHCDGSSVRSPGKNAARDGLRDGKYAARLRDALRCRASRRSAARWCGRACSRCCLAERSTRSR